MLAGCPNPWLWPIACCPRPEPKPKSLPKAGLSLPKGCLLSKPKSEKSSFFLQNITLSRMPIMTSFFSLTYFTNIKTLLLGLFGNKRFHFFLFPENRFSRASDKGYREYVCCLEYRGFRINNYAAFLEAREQ